MRIRRRTMRRWPGGTHPASTDAAPVDDGASLTRPAARPLQGAVIVVGLHSWKGFLQPLVIQVLFQAPFLVGLMLSPAFDRGLPAPLLPCCIASHDVIWSSTD